MQLEHSSRRVEHHDLPHRAVRVVLPHLHLIYPMNSRGFMFTMTGPFLLRPRGTGCHR
jgi:hypothetical protein